MWNKRREAAKPSLKWRIVRIVLLCWIFPFLLVTISMLRLVTNSISENTVQSYKDSADFNARISVERLDRAVEASRLTSYDYDIKKAFRYFRSGSDSFDELYSISQGYLTRRFSSDDRFGYAIMWYWKSPQDYYSYTVNDSLVGRYALDDYWENDHELVMSRAKVLDTDAAFLNCNGRLYLVRNVMDGQLGPMAVLVVALNEQYFFSDFNLLSWQSGYNIYVDDTELYRGGNPSERTGNLVAPVNQSVYYDNGSNPLVYGARGGLGYTLRYTANVEPRSTYDQLEAFRFVLVSMLVMLLPLIFVAIRFFYSNVSRPVEQLQRGAREIEIGNFGYQLKMLSVNREFDYLEQSFNKMSLQLEDLFHRIYDEELALRDAKIKALQSQINPHFLNNTLEIINWEARMLGSVKVSKMIESLSTMLDAAMARDGRKTVRLSEEMMYVDAYFYIISERLGKRLTIERDVDNTLLEHNVPRLILQPIIENAVEHGITPRQQGTIQLRIAHEGDWLLLEIYNDGVLTAEDTAEVERLLSDDDITPLSPSRSIGIRNVHQRLRILYGTGSGLSILPTSDGRVVATIRIPLARDGQGQ